MTTVSERKTICIYLDAEAVYITKTGWDDYHVIREIGDIGEVEYSRMNGLTIFSKYQINPNLLLNTTNDTRTLN